MKFDNKYHPRSFMAKMMMGKIFSATGKSPYGKGELLVLNYHSTPAWLMQEFEEQVRYLSQHFNLVPPSYIDSFYDSGDIKTEDPKPSVVFTFDDGLKNNLHAAAVLEKYNTRGLFFLVPGFFNAAPEVQQAYYLEHIRNQVNYNIDTQHADVTAMNIDDIGSLLSGRHRIGSHSFTHTMNRDDDVTKSEQEVIRSKHFLENKFNIPVKDFCAPFDSLRSTNRHQMDLIRQHYQYFHSTFPGSNKELHEPFFICRVNVECWWPLDVMKFSLSRFEWSRYREKRERFRSEILGG